MKQKIKMTKKKLFNEKWKTPSQIFLNRKERKGEGRKEEGKERGRDRIEIIKIRYYKGASSKIMSDIKGLKKQML